MPDDETIDLCEFKDGTAIVLRSLMVGKTRPWVTGYCTHWRSAAGDYYFGHYFEDEAEAREDYNRRVERERKRR